MPDGSRRHGRLTSLALVLLPALLLAAFGARAVQSEVARARNDARVEAQAVADGLATAFARTVAETLAPLPEAGAETTIEAAEVALRHLAPRFAVDDAGTLLDIRGLVARPAAEDVAAARGIQAEAYNRTDALLEAGDRLAASTVLAAAAEAVDVADVRAELRLDAAKLDADAGELASSLRVLGLLLDEDAPVIRPDWDTEYPLRVQIGLPSRAPAKVAAFELLFEVLAGAGESPVPPPPAWLGDVHAALVRDRYGFTPPLRDEFAARLRVHFDDAQRAAAEADVDRWQQARQEGPGDRGTEVLVTTTGALMLRRRVRLVLDGDVRDAWIGGELPQATLAERLADVVALARTRGVVGPALFSPGGRLLVGQYAPDAAHDGLRVRAGVPGALLAGFRVEAVTARADRVPRGALVLGAGVVVASLALLLGALLLQRNADRSASLAEERRRFLDHVAHEIRTPASALLALSDELAAGHVEAKQQPVYYAHLATESRRLARLVDETLDLARLEAGGLSALMEPVDLVPVVRAAVDEAAGGDGDVRVTLPQGPVPVSADVPALRRAIRNLVENAVRHGRGAAPPEVSLAVEAGVARIVVTDSGSGIPPEHLPRLFERFYRVPSETHEVKGVGIGLALCREVARAHGGDVTVRSTPGAGATFTLVLPAPGDGARGYRDLT